MNSTTVLIAAAVLVFLVMPFNETAFSILFAATVWLLREAHVRRVSGQAFSPAFRALLWAAAVFSGLLGIAAGALSVLILTDKNPGWGANRRPENALRKSETSGGAGHRAHNQDHGDFPAANHGHSVRAAVGFVRRGEERF